MRIPLLDMDFTILDFLGLEVLLGAAHHESYPPTLWINIRTVPLMNRIPTTPNSLLTRTQLVCIGIDYVWYIV